MEFFKKKLEIPEHQKQEYIQRIKQVPAKKIKHTELKLEPNTHFK
jgi:hypothetical protein